MLIAHSSEDALGRFDEAQASGDGLKAVFFEVIMLGGANGLVLAEQVGSRDPSESILLIASYHDKIAIEGLQPHAMDVLGKPYRRSELIDHVQSALHMARGLDRGDRVPTLVTPMPNRAEQSGRSLLSSVVSLCLLEG